MGRKPTTGARYGITGPLQDDLIDFCEAHRGAPIDRIIRDALRAFIDDRLAAEPELKKRFDEARRLRLGAKDSVVQLVPKNGEC
ncbi:MAG: hypothetical protein GEU95_17900 [Rhizobiales bacterium]|nr:hypothetical protein [Hyphomicrobiales bacterium]